MSSVWPRKVMSPLKTKRYIMKELLILSSSWRPLVNWVKVEKFSLRELRNRRTGCRFCGYPIFHEGDVPFCMLYFELFFNEQKLFFRKLQTCSAKRTTSTSLSPSLKIHHERFSGTVAVCANLYLTKCIQRFELRSHSSARFCDYRSKIRDVLYLTLTDTANS